MTDLGQRPTRTREPAAARQDRGLPLPASCALAAGWALLAGALAVCAVFLVGWLVDGRTDAGAWEAARLGLQGYLLAHGGTLGVPWGTLGLPPLGLTVLPVWLLMRAGASVARRHKVASLRVAGLVIATVTASYAALLALLAFVVSTATVSASPVRAGLGGLVLAAVGSSIGVLREAGSGLLPLGRLPGPRPAGGAAVLAGFLTLLGLGALVVAVALAPDTGRYAELSRAVAPTWTGAVGLALLALLLLPNAAVFAVAVGLGPGFALGADTAVTPSGSHLGEVPALPLLAALPDGGTSWPTMVVPLCVAVVIGVVLTARLDPEDSRGVASTAAWAAGTGVVIAAAAGVLGYAAGGPLGAGRLATIGASGLQLFLFAAVELAVLAAATAALLRHRQLRPASD